MADFVTSWTLTTSDQISPKVAKITKDLGGLERQADKVGKSGFGEASKGADQLGAKVRDLNGRFIGAARSAEKLADRVADLGKRKGGVWGQLKGLFSDITRLGQGGMGGVGNALQDMTSRAIPAGGAMGQLSGVLARVGPAGIAAAAALALVGAGTVKAAGFSHDFRQLANMNLSKSTTEIAAMGDAIQDLAFKKGMDPKAMLTGFYDLQSIAGKVGGEAAGIADKVGDFAKTRVVDFNQQLLGTAKAMKSFNFGVEGVDRFQASSDKVVQVGVATYEQLAAVRTEYLDQVAGAGMDYESGDKLFALFSAGAKSVDIAATLTKGAFEGITDGTAVKELAKLGVNVFDPVTGKVRELHSIVKDMVPAFGAMSDQKFAATRDAIGGPEGLGMLLNKVKANGEGVMDVFEGFDKASVDSSKAMALANKDVTALWETTKNRFSIALMRVGEQILPSLADGLGFVNETMMALAGHTDGVGESAKALAGFLEGVGSVASALATTLRYALMPLTAIYDIGKWASDNAFGDSATAQIAAKLKAGERVNINGSGDPEDLGLVSTREEQQFAGKLKQQREARMMAFGASRKGVDAFIDEAAAAGQPLGSDAELLLGLRGRLAGSEAGANLEGLLAKGGTKAEEAALKMVAASAARYRKEAADPADSLIPGAPKGGPGGLPGGTGGKDAGGMEPQSIVGGQKITHINVNIGKFQDAINIHTTTMVEGTAQLTAMIEETLIKAVRNAEVVIGQ